MSRRWASVLALMLTLTVALTFAAGCGEPEEGESWLELAGALPLAEVRTVAGDGAATGEERAGVRARGEDLYLPLGARIDFFVRPPAGAVLETRSLRRHGVERGWIEVSVRVEGEEENREIGRLEATSGESLELPADGERAIRLRLSAAPTPSDSSSEEAGLLVGRPTLSAPVAQGVPREAAAGSPEPAPPGSESLPGGPPNVLVYMIDTVRADHLGCYGYERPVSPAIDAFARDSVLFEDAVAQSSWTRPSVASLFTGLWPGTHGVHGDWDILTSEARTLAEVLQDHGYRTAGVITNRHLARLFGVDQGFETYRMLRMEDTSADVHEVVVDWLSRWREEARSENQHRPFFLYVHTVDPHSPYDPPERFRERFAAAVPRDATGQVEWLKRLKRGELGVTAELIGNLVDLYDAEITANDESFGRLIDWLASEGLLEETVIVLLSDHGEEFHEHGSWEHGKNLYAESVHIPLIIRFPGPDGRRLRGRRVAVPVQHTDVLPTLLTHLGVPVPAALEGRDLGPLLAGAVEVSGEEVPIFSQLRFEDCRIASVTTKTWRLIDRRCPPNGERVELFDRQRDPGEQRDLAALHPVTAGFLRSHLVARELAKKGALRSGEAEVDEETREQLRALGYLN